MEVKIFFSVTPNISFVYYLDCKNVATTRMSKTYRKNVYEPYTGWLILQRPTKYISLSNYLISIDYTISYQNLTAAAFI